MKKLAMVAVAALAISAVVAGALLTGLEMRDASAQEATGDKTAASESESGSDDKGDTDGKTYSEVAFDRIMVPVIEGGRTKSYLRMNVTLEIATSGEGEKKSGDSESPLKGKRAAVLDSIITALYDLDGNLVLERGRDVERVRRTVRLAAGRVVGSGKVGDVHFGNLIQQPVSGL